MPEDLKQASDLVLARLSRGGDESAFAEIMRRYGPRVFRVASRFFRQRAQVEEAAQEVFLKAFTQLGSYEGRGPLEGWLTRIATNTCLNLLRGMKRRPELTASDRVEQIMSDARQQLRAVRKESEPRLAEVRRQTDERLRQTLTPEQWQQFQGLKDSMRGKKRGRGRGGEGDPAPTDGR